ncbi:4Fe-4S binding protein [Leptolinea tardivitalis]|uniref:4Fe-4S ferredoxin n=1 Tax=Leptolinea tardivitalis TaxID=229920 RepID=A0A0P6XEF4_9CHLR|nr:4Fe-4S binding protein [Leptolinea tardivitalis]KPL73216.1 4Fe-4S ferredoxin [Leptolinea tardivitalis]GAP21319.1 protein containing 4Fe-4S binding domain [Leptolinea tardivitalis]
MKPLIRPSTRAFYREARKNSSFSLFNFIHGYVYARWVYFYLAMGTGRHPLAVKLKPLVSWIGNQIIKSPHKDESSPTIKIEDTYHGKVVPLEAARELVSVKEDIQLGDLEKVIPYALARDIVFKNPDHIVALDCPCRVAKEDSCTPIDVCLIIGEPFASLVLEHHPDRSRAITSEEAQAIIKAEDDRGHVHHAFFKDAMLGRFYAICNCCSCCCGAIEAQRNGTPMLASSGYVAVIDDDKCQMCGICQKKCQFSAISHKEKYTVNTAVCMGCGVCVNQCKSNAIHLVRDASRGEPLEIRELIRNFMQ